MPVNEQREETDEEFLAKLAAMRAKRKAEAAAAAEAAKPRLQIPVTPKLAEAVKAIEKLPEVPKPPPGAGARVWIVFAPCLPPAWPCNRARIPQHGPGSAARRRRLLIGDGWLRLRRRVRRPIAEDEQS